MIVYGDRVERQDPREKLARVIEALGRARVAHGVDRHSSLTLALIEAGELAQGVADAAFDVAGMDGPCPTGEAAMSLVMRLARAVADSWRSDFSTEVPERLPELTRIAASPLPDRLGVKRAEGFAFYAVYPECYLEAALACGGMSSARVIGIRSVGLTLAAMVATALECPPPATFRPTGHPFRREVAVAEELAADLVSDASTEFAVVDEGPGLSGSSFGAVADFLEGEGVAPDRIRYFPSHSGGPGPHALPRHRRRWAAARRHVVSAQDLLFAERTRPAHRPSTWAASLVGRTMGQPQDISAGRWRALRFARESDWPPVRSQHERLKYLLRAADGKRWLLKFAGLGVEGERKLSLAAALASAGFAPSVAGLRHGFLIEDWIEAEALEPRAADRRWMVGRLARYLVFRARRFSAPPGEGASLEALWRMARHNAELALGANAARRLDAWLGRLDRLQASLRPVATDNRMHVWEWLVTSDGRLLKADAVDHHAAHDLVGCQDIAWDVVGATVELELSDGERDRLRDAVAGETGREISDALLAFLTPIYLAFQLGDHSLAALSARANQDGEASRLESAVDRYSRQLQVALRG